MSTIAWVTTSVPTRATTACREVRRYGKARLGAEGLLVTAAQCRALLARLTFTIPAGWEAITSVSSLSPVPSATLLHCKQTYAYALSYYRCKPCSVVKGVCLLVCCISGAAAGGLGCYLAPCHEPAGHPGAHNCGDPTHECGMDCALYNLSGNCARRCKLPPGHEGSHECSTRVHLCGSTCSLSSCGQMCTLPYGHDPSERHQCSNRGCPETCELCQFPCSCADHFHAEQDGAVHLCSNSHPCPHMCSIEGLCEIRSELRRERRTWQGQRGTFEYDHVTEQMCVR